MEGRIWRVKVLERCNFKEGKHVVCAWNCEESRYDVYFRGICCGLVEKDEAGRTLSDFVSGVILTVEWDQLCIQIGARRCCGKVSPIVLPFECNIDLAA